MSLFAAGSGDVAGGNVPWLITCIGFVGLGALLWLRTKLAGTTLVAPWLWSLLALALLATSEIVIALAGEPVPPWGSPLRFAAAVSTCCPAMALLGAKRPQNRGWQLIVFSLWAILSLPSIEWLLFGGTREIHPARFWFLAILIVVGVSNSLGTRFWPASVSYGAGQLVLLAPFFSASTALAGMPAPLLGVSALALAWCLIAADFPRSRKAAAPLDRVWLDFRDAFGVVWALRIMERMNASATMYDWPLRLTWRGFAARNAHEAAPQLPPGVEEGLRTLLRRFVSPAWIDVRLGSSARDPNLTAPIS